jgi:hypothetical protein
MAGIMLRPHIVSGWDMLCTPFLGCTEVTTGASKLTRRLTVPTRSSTVTRNHDAPSVRVAALDSPHVTLVSDANTAALHGTALMLAPSIGRKLRPLTVTLAPSERAMLTEVGAVHTGESYEKTAAGADHEFDSRGPPNTRTARLAPAEVGTVQVSDVIDAQLAVKHNCERMLIEALTD